ncbi:MAG TPA: enoyl-CoA hydratase-related protein [Ilumatobacteraceae bacterium]|nr:enoyl-CoA hydratase-related protein [Ilumatobacteraceae bacterium]
MLHVADADHVRTLTLDRPEAKNAFNQALYGALGAALTDALADDDVHVVVITGYGTAFSAGQDLKEMASMAAGEHSGSGAGFNSVLEPLETAPKPVIAAVNGAAVGIGMTMLLHCDLVLVAESARMRVPFSELGVPPEAGSSALLADRIGWQAAAELFYTSKWVTANDAVNLRIALRAVPDHELLDEAHALAAKIAAASPWSIQRTKQLMLEARGQRPIDARQRESASFAELFRLR